MKVQSTSEYEFRITIQRVSFRVQVVQVGKMFNRRLSIPLLSFGEGESIIEPLMRGSSVPSGSQIGWTQSVFISRKPRRLVKVPRGTL